ncbi:hypothetical protein [Endozoicomonas sp. 8E]|uniref:hypothetical protein n=1 Tax=Endozoicomonas sp. 8E TaxID=3035692 RepID=UPI002938F679|nr:hypothetical protein [Endozoicomonas sp. 8E]WOG26897.1 hypothetical protein P6910_20465 [Endozoicomonas sp. 8E]
MKTSKGVIQGNSTTPLGDTRNVLDSVIISTDSGFHNRANLQKSMDRGMSISNAHSDLNALI